MASEFRILIEAYTQALADGDTETANVLLQEMDGLAVVAHADRTRAELSRDWLVGQPANLLPSPPQN
jgi:hypothetical protein